MKKLMILFAVMAMFSGCAHMPSWMLRGHVDGYNALHPDEPIEVEDGLEKGHGTD